MRGTSLQQTLDIPALGIPRRTLPQRGQHMGHLESPPLSFVSHVLPDGEALMPTIPVLPVVQRDPGMGSAMAIRPHYRPNERPGTTPDPDVWLIALPLAGGGTRSLEGAGRSGPIRVGRPYGHLRSVRPVNLDTGQAVPDTTSASVITRRARRGQATAGRLGNASVLPLRENVPAPQPAPVIVSAVEVETDAGLFRVERRGSVLGHTDLAWALAHLEPGEPDSMVPLPRRQLALLLTLLPTPENPDRPEQDPTWGWAHKLRGPWERGPLHGKGKLGRLIAFDPDDSGRGMHRACFELLGTDEIVWAVGVPCFRTGSVYELTPLGKGLNPSRWLTWPITPGRKRAGSAERPGWEIARVVYRVGAPRWPLAGVVEPLGPMGVGG